jgi:hypothetical protein
MLTWAHPLSEKLGSAMQAVRASIRWRRLCVPKRELSGEGQRLARLALEDSPASVDEGCGSIIGSKPGASFEDRLGVTGHDKKGDQLKAEALRQPGFLARVAYYMAGRCRTVSSYCVICDQVSRLQLNQICTLTDLHTCICHSQPPIFGSNIMLKPFVCGNPLCVFQFTEMKVRVFHLNVLPSSRYSLPRSKFFLFTFDAPLYIFWCVHIYS